MAGSIVGMSTNGSTDWSNFVLITQHSYRHYRFVSITNTTSTGPPAIEAGSYATVNGTMYQLTPSSGGNESISTTGLSTGFTKGELWIKVVPNSTGNSITAEMTTTAPAWNAVKGGYYSTGNDRYLGGVYKSTGAYGIKWLYDEGIKITGSNRPLLQKKVDLGYWNMSVTLDAGDTSHSAAHGLVASTRIEGWTVNLKSDDRSAFYETARYYGSAANGGFGLDEVDGTNFNFYNMSSGFFDSADFRSTSVSRGDILVYHRG